MTFTIGSNSLLLAQHAYRTWHINIPHGTNPESLLDPAAWKHHASQVRPLDVIRAFSEDGAWEMWMTVLKPEPPAAVYVSKLFLARHGEVASKETADLKIEWKGPALQFCIIRTSDGEPVRKNLYPKDVAEAELIRMKQKAA